ncbi:hypothetical protein JW707_03480 [Candidatus Woesearchaeota archaeon]|nr:hypothetical protein [Candidatus Woesearchaeota archaeon]
MPRRTLILIVLILLLAPSAAAFTKITGFVPGKFNEKRLNLNLVLDKSQMQTFDLALPEGSELISVKLCGKVIGPGRAMAVMDYNGTGLEIFSYNERKDGIAETITDMFADVENALTGSAVLDTGSTNNTGEISFTSECIDTCYLKIDDMDKIDIFFLVDEGTTVEIEHLEYHYVPLSERGPSWISMFFSKILNIFR